MSSTTTTHNVTTGAVEDGLPLYQTIVVGTDGSPTAQEAVRHAIALSRALNARLHLVSADPGKTKRTVDRESAGAPADIAHRINAREDVASMLDDIAQGPRSYGAEVTCHPEIDVSPADAILAVAKRSGADLIIVGNRGMTGMGRVLGSVPNKISHSATCSVTIIRTVD